ncbi:MAG: glycosyltransferase family 4 protein [Bacteroidales bacterium]
MKILIITTGSGDSFYCGNCLRDNTYARALLAQKHEVILMPLYLPVQEVSPAESGSGTPKRPPLFFGAIAFFVSQQWFRNQGLPGWLERWLNRPFFLRLAARMAGSTRVKGLEEHTLSMIEGGNSAFRKEAEKLIDWIETENPEVIHLSNTLIIGLAPLLKKRVNIPVVCSLQDEDSWIDLMEEPYRSRAWQGIVNQRRYLDGLVTPSTFYKEKMMTRLPALAPISVIPTGWTGKPLFRPTPEAPLPPAFQSGVKALNPPVIGFLSRMNEANGLDILAEAFVLLKKKNRLPSLRLHVAGGSTRDDARFMKRVHKLLAPYAQFVSIDEGEFLRTDKTQFLMNVSVLAVPLRFEEAFGLYLAEGFATGTPALMPDTGSSAEVIGKAGRVYLPNTPEKLASELEQLLSNKPEFHTMQTEALTATATRFGAEAMAKALEQFYRESAEKRE